LGISFVSGAHHPLREVTPPKKERKKASTLRLGQLISLHQTKEIIHLNVMKDKKKNPWTRARKIKGPSL